MHNSLLAELQRRNVLRAAAFYAAAAWLAVQVATQVFPFFNVPNWVVRLVVVAVVVGFPLALAFAWFYEVTPQGIRRESQVDRSDPQLQASAKRLDRWIIAVLALAVALLLADRFVLHSAVEQPVTGRSIAVLPFENLSADPANAYFADGIQDEILTRLAKIGALHVVSRTSTQQYAAKPGNLPDIARQLGVATVLEGSVQKVGDAVRVTVQLIKAATDEHLWAETYDRKLDDIFGVETEVAQAIASELQIKLSGGEQSAVMAMSTRNPEAYQAYLQGLSIETRNLSSNNEGARSAAAAYAQAVRQDPAFAQAWARLAIVRSFMYFNFIDRTDDALAQIKQAADTALQLQPELGEAYLALGYYRYRGLRDFEGGLKAFEQARQRLPNNADVLSSISYIERRQGKWREAVGHLEQASWINPLGVAMLNELATNYAALREFAKERSTLDRALAIAPTQTSLVAQKARSFQNEGDLDSSRKLLATLPQGIDDEAGFTVRVDQWVLERNYSAAIAAMRGAQPECDRSEGELKGFCHFYLAWVLKWSGDEAAARSEFVVSLHLIEAMRKSAADDAHLAQIFAIVYAGLGDEAQALRWARLNVEANAGDALVKPRAEGTLAQVLGGFGHVTEAVAMVPHLLEVPNGETRASMRLHPVWDSLRTDPAFLKLIATDADPAATATKL